jgi:NAD(P)-dependent dehydrogenase (short-subunit alcohol dehydrogenase family)
MLKGKSVLVTGGSRGIGFACAAEALRGGASVTICARGARDVRAAQDLLAGEFGAERVVALPADVSREGDVERVCEAALTAFGALDAVIHAAAILAPIGNVLEVDATAWRANLDVNVFGTFAVVRHAARRMRGRGGRIVAFSGGGASGPFPNYTAYACSKVAVVRFVETVAQELRAEGIEINALAPGFVATRMHQETLAAGAAAAGADYLERTKGELESGGVPPEVPAAAAVFLISERARGITGKFVSAVYDGWQHWPDHLAELDGGDLFTLRRILPKERGLSWQ